MNQLSAHHRHFRYSTEFYQSRQVVPPITVSSAPVPMTVRSRLRRLRPIHTGHASPPIVDTPFAKPKQVRLIEIYQFYRGLMP
jgi:hypothetical protein